MILEIGFKTLIMCLLVITLGTVALTLSTLVIYEDLAAQPEEIMPPATSGGECSVGILSLRTPGTIKEFRSLGELKRWLELDDLDSYVYIEHSFDCDDFAFELQTRALRDGYYMSVQAEKSPHGEPHTTNVTKIGNILYRVAAETDEVTELCLLD